MYHNYAFKDAKEFQKLFGIVEHGNGAKSRKNRILLAVLKSQSFRRFIADNELEYLWKLDSMGALKQVIKTNVDFVSPFWIHNAVHPIELSVTGARYRSSMYATDTLKGICEDGDSLAIRYTNMKTGKVYKMRAGKFFMRVLMDNKLFAALPEQARIWYVEELVAGYQSKVDVFKYNLHVDTDFEAIYSCDGNFGSCMQDKGYHSFYKKALDWCRAAYLTDEHDKIVARCVIYKAYDEGENEWRLAERQYALNGSDKLKSVLIAKLIAAGEIDGYKSIGAGCGDAEAFVANCGDSLSGKIFHIHCSLENGDYVSYQDSFKWYDVSEELAYNDPSKYYDFELDITSGRFGCYYDEYHECYCDSVIECYYNGEWINVDANRLEDFRFLERKASYYHENDVCYCEECEDYFPDYEGYFSEITGDTYCCKDCKGRAEERYKEENWFWSSWDEQYYPNEEDVFDIDGGNETMCRDTLDGYLASGDIIDIDGEYWWRESDYAQAFLEEMEVTDGNA